MKNYTPFFLFFCLLWCLTTTVYAQEDLRIKDNNGNTLMEVREEGVLIRQLSTAERTAINLTGSDNGILVYDTDTKSFWAWKDTDWEELNSEATSELPVNPAPGTIAYYDGNNWLPIAPGNYGAFLSICDGVPSWGGCLPKVAIDPTVQTLGLSINISIEVLTDGGAPLTANGIVWSTSPNPTLADFNDGNQYPGITTGVGVGINQFGFSNADFATTYYVRAYAENSLGLVYSDEISFTTIPEDPLEVILPNNDVIEVYPINLPFAYQWMGFPQQDIAGVPNTGSFEFADAIMDYNGESNTMAIVSELGNLNNGNYAAKRCADFVSGDGKDDWYLPAAGELYTIFQQLGPAGNNGITGSNGSAYWSSSELNTAAAWVITPQPGGTTFGKSSASRCRCVRRD